MVGPARVIAAGVGCQLEHGGHAADTVLGLRSRPAGEGDGQQGARAPAGLALTRDLDLLDVVGVELTPHPHRPEREDVTAWTARS